MTTPDYTEIDVEGFKILVGKNNRENDYLTHKVARKDDLWLHAQGIPGSHVIIKSQGKDIPDEVIEEAAKFAGARDVVLMEEPMAAAIGAGLPVGEPTGSMIVDIGGGTTEVAIISLGGIVTSKSLRVAGDELDQSIIAYIKKEFNLMIGERTAEQVKMELGSAYKVDDEVREMDIKGRDMITGLPKTVTVGEDQIREALKEPVYAIIESIKTTLEKTPPELAADIMEKGIMLAGGGALLRGLDALINHETNMPVHIAESPLDCVVLGAGKALDNFDELSKTQRGQ